MKKFALALATILVGVLLPTAQAASSTPKDTTPPAQIAPIKNDPCPGCY